jgi:Fe-S-cluster containining protein
MTKELNKKDGRTEMMEKIMKDIDKKGEGLQPTDEFNFSCDSCGICCHNIDIILSPLDILRIRKSLELPTMEIIEKFTITYIGDTSKMPVCLLKFTQISKDITACPFLVPEFFEELKERIKKEKIEQNSPELSALISELVDKCPDKKVKQICSIQKDKPEICRLFPLGRIFAQKIDCPDKKKTMYFKQPKESLPCSGDCFKCKRTVGDHLKDNNLGKLADLQEEYNEFLADASQFMMKHENLLELPALGMIMYDFDRALLFQKIRKDLYALKDKDEISKIVVEKSKIFEVIPELDSKIFLKLLKKDATEEEEREVYKYLLSCIKETFKRIKEKYDKASENRGDKAEPNKS